MRSTVALKSRSVLCNYAQLEAASASVSSRPSLSPGEMQHLNLGNVLEAGFPSDSLVKSNDLGGTGSITNSDELETIQLIFL